MYGANIPNVLCAHGKTLQRDQCDGCEASEDIPHDYNPRQVRDRHTRKIVSRCHDCGLTAGNTAHKPER
jgi:hypothetical protein